MNKIDYLNVQICSHTNTTDLGLVPNWPSRKLPLDCQNIDKTWFFFKKIAKNCHFFQKKLPVSIFWRVSSLLIIPTKNTFPFPSQLLNKYSVPTAWLSVTSVLIIFSLSYFRYSNSSWWTGKFILKSFKGIMQVPLPRFEPETSLVG